MDLQYVGDVAEAFAGCLLASREGAYVFNLQGEVIRMDELIGLLDRLRPGASRLITAEGPGARRLARGRRATPRICAIPHEDAAGKRHRRNFAEVRRIKAIRQANLEQFSANLCAFTY